MEYESQWVYTTCTLLLLTFGVTFADRGKVYMVISPESVVVPIDDGTSLSCEMNLAPDRFQWRYYPLGSRLASDPKAPIYLALNYSEALPSDMISNEKKSSKLHIKVDSTSVAGDYQCLAHYGASVVASVPGRLTVTSFEASAHQEKLSVTVVAGNTVSLRCDPPVSNPPAAIDYYKNTNLVRRPFDALSNTLILKNVTPGDSGFYSCMASNVITRSVAESGFSCNLRVVNSGPREAPRFITQPKNSYTVIAGETAFLECSAIGNPVPVVTWQKSGGLLPKDRTQMVPGGLKIVNVSSTDDGVYVCRINNPEGQLVYKITLIYNEAPTVISGPDGAEIKEGENLDLMCMVKGTPEPIISWFLNGRSVKNDSLIEAIGNKIYFTPVEKRHAGILQCFASNIVGTVYSTANLKVIPKQISSSDIADEYSNAAPTAPAHRNKKRKHKGRKHKGHKGTAEMIPPSKPNVSRLNDESVMVRWSVPPNNGLPIQFFKVQYRELGPTANANGTNIERSKGSRWKTTNADIPPHIRSYEVNNLKADHIYKFRIAAVYSNNDNKLGPNSAKFHLIRQDFFARNPLSVPRLTHTETVNSTSIKIYWEYTSSPNVTTDGFYINYQSASSAGDYTKATVDGEKTRNYVITHLQPDTFYDIKLQSFNTRTASEFSPILKQRTARLVTESPPISEVTSGTSTTTSQPAIDMTKLYVYIGAGIVGFAAVSVGILLLIICRKRKEKKENGADGRDGDHVDKHSVVMEDGGAHHIQADGNGYIVSPKTVSRANGCGPQPNNRITITANPLAEADKTQNMIEMSCLSSQNNNCSVTSQPSVSDESNRSDSLTKSKLKQREKHKRGGKVPPTTSGSERSAGENYV